MTSNKSNYREVSIVVVDDDDVDVMGIERAFKKLKILNPIVRARDGIEGLTLLRDSTAVRRPYIILLDINMPRMNGLEMLCELRNDPSLSSAVVFILTTSKADEDKVSAYQRHIAGYIIKDKVEEGFLPVIEMLDRYWRIVELPINN